MEQLTCKDIAKDLGISLRTVQLYVKEGFIPSSFKFQGSKKHYSIDSKDYFEWKQKYFSRVKRGDISKYTRADKPLTISGLESLISDWLDSLRTGTLNGRIYSMTTIETYEYFIFYYLRALGFRPNKPLISKNNLKKVFASIPAKQYATKQKIYDAVMCFSQYLIEEEKLSYAEREEMKKLRPKRFIPASKITLSEGQIVAAIKASQEMGGNSQYDKLLTKTLIIFFKETGLRASELCNLKFSDIDLESKVVYVWLGKGNKNRKVGITSSCYEVLEQYLISRLDLIVDVDRFFVNSRGGALTRNALRLRWDKLSRICGFKITNHSFRRSFVTINVNKGKPLVHLQIAAGHSDIKTTRGYCLTSENEVTEAMKGW